MKAELLLHERYQVRDDAFAEIKIWRVPAPVRGSAHGFRYSLAFVVGGDCVLRYDNEPGKGDHRHMGAVEESYCFTGPERLIADFRRDIEEWRAE